MMFYFLFVRVCTYIEKYHEQYSKTWYQRYSLENRMGYGWDPYHLLNEE